MARNEKAGASWDAMVLLIDGGIDRVGFWSGEAGVLRDAIGAQRLGRRVGQRILAALDDAGLECDTDPIRYESEPLLIRRKGAEALATLIESLLPAIRETDLMIPDGAPWRDHLVATRSLRHWRPPIA